MEKSNSPRVTINIPYLREIVKNLVWAISDLPDQLGNVTAM